MIELSVKDVREALASVARPGDRGTGEAATLLLGRLFHEVFADLVSADPERSGLRVIAESGPEQERRVEALLEHAWRRLVAPRLLRHAAELQSTTEPVLALWRAIEHLARWLTAVALELLAQADRAAAGRSPLPRGGAQAPGDRARPGSMAGPRGWEHLAELLRAEVPLRCDLREPTWGERVRLVGIADSILRVPARAAFCAIELKLGRAAPPIDLGQAALYRLILVRSGAQDRDAALALLRFAPELDEQLFQAPALAEAEARLLDLIAGLARVPRIEPDPAAAPVTPASPARPEPPGVTSAPGMRGVSGAPDVQGAPAAGGKHAVDAPSPGILAPPVTLASPPVGAPGEGAPASPHVEMGRRLKRACGEQGVGLDVRGEPIVGPRFLRFQVRLSPGARLDALRNRMPEVAHRLALPQEPIVTQEAGALFIDVARPDPEIVPFERVAAQLPRLDPLIGSARVPIGVDSGGRLHFADLASAGRSHVLVAGTSGSGKSEWLRVALAGLFASNTPDTLRIVTIDPKLNAFGDLERSRFLWTPDAWWVPGTDREATDVFDDLIEEMERRYQLTRASGSDNLAEHVKKTGRPLARIVCLCDEYMALVAADREARKRIEGAVTLLGAKARAAGIHLVLATQQPSRSVVSGAIQANLACRVALTLTSHIESNMILGTSGAERLTGSGDLLYKDFGLPQRLQAPLLSAEERRRRFLG